MENNSKEYTIEEATEKGTKQLEEQIEAEIEEKQNILREKCRSIRNGRICRSKCNIWSYWKYRNAGENRRNKRADRRNTIRYLPTKNLERKR